MPLTKHAMIRIARLVAMMRENRYPNYPQFLKEMRNMDAGGAYKISQKTLQRDIEFLKSEYNAPIKYDYSAKGYYLTDPEWTWECPLLEPEEMKASLLGARLAESILPEPLRGEIRKAVDNQLMNNEKGLDENASLDSLIATISHRSKIDADIFGIIFKAWESHRTLKVHYQKIGYCEIREFTVEPHVLTLFDGCWYIKGKMIKKEDWDCAEWGYPDMILALPRVKKAKILDTTFETDKRLVREVASGKLYNLEEVHNVTLKVEGISAEYVKEQFPDKDIKCNNDGTVTLHIPAAVRFTLVKWILGEGGNVTVITPRSLAEEIREKAIMIAEKTSTSYIQEL